MHYTNTQDAHNIQKTTLQLYHVPFATIIYEDKYYKICCLVHAHNSYSRLFWFLPISRQQFILYLLFLRQNTETGFRH